METDGWMFFPGDVVCYCGRHHEYLIDIARWPSPRISRTDVRGKVVSSTQDTVTVKWERTTTPSIHLPGNLERMSPAHEEERP